MYTLIPQSIIAATVANVIIGIGLCLLSDQVRRQLRSGAGKWYKASRRPQSAEPGRTPDGLPDGLYNVECEVRAVLFQFAEQAADRHVELAIAIHPKLIMCTDVLTFRNIISDAINSSLMAASGGCIMACARQDGERIMIMVADDSLDLQPGTRAHALQSHAQAVALQGGSLSVESRSGMGSIVILELPSASGHTVAAGPAEADNFRGVGQKEAVVGEQARPTPSATISSSMTGTTIQHQPGRRPALTA